MMPATERTSRRALRHARLVTLVAAGAACSAASPGAGPAPPRLTCRVTAVSDGDTFRATCPLSVRVRLLLIDAPELDQRPFGAAARSQLSRLLPRGATVALEQDVQARDQFGRLLAYAFLPDGRLVNEEMTRSGFAVALVYPPNVRYVERIRAGVAAARAAGRGLWATDGFGCTPKEHRQRRC
jgi:micrococcal nuclease